MTTAVHIPFLHFSQRIDLADPTTYYPWIDEMRAAHHDAVLLAAELELSLHWAAPLRSAQLWIQSGQRQRAAPLIAQCLLSQHPAIRALAFGLLASDEMGIDVRADGVGCGSSASATHILERQIEEVRRATATPLNLEAQVTLLIIQAELHAEHRRPEDAMTSASEAILVARAMQLPVFLRAAKLAYAVAAHRGEYLTEAHLHYQQVAAQAAPGSRQHLYAQMNSALLHLRHGEDHVARTELLRLTEDHKAAALGSSLQYARAVSALVPEDEPVLSCPSGNYDGIVRALQLLCADQGQPTPLKLHLLLDGLGRWEPRSASLQPLVAWLQGSALLRLGQPLLAAARIGSSYSALPDISAMLLCLKIELALHIHGCDLAPLPTLCAELREVFDALPHHEARYGMAQRLVLWHPLASAYVGCSPVSIPALVDAVSPVVFRDGRPIQVHGRVAPTRLPFVQMTLAAFGVHSTLPRDQSAERERMAQAFLVDHGSGKRWLPIVPPAQLVYHLCRTSETHGATWHYAAQEVARVHGLVPRTLGAFLREERKQLHRALNDLLHRRSTVSQFRNVLATLAPGD